MQLSIKYLSNTISVLRNWGRYSIFFIINLWFGVNLLSQGSGWTAPNPANYSHSATMTTLVYFDDNLNSDANDEVAFFVGNEIRGLASGVMIAGNIYYFITIYSNQASESMTVKYYNANLDMIFTSSIPFLFNSGQTYGNFDTPYELYFYEDNITPITLDSIPDQFGMEHCPLPSIYLSEYLNQQETYGTVWSYINNPNLVVTLLSDTLSIVGNPGYNGNTILTVIATSQAPGNPTDSADIAITIIPHFAPPSFGLIPGQGIVKGDTFEAFDLNQFESGYGGSHLTFNYLPVVEENANPIGPPSWTSGSSYTYNMTVTAQVNYTPNYQFDHGDDILGAYLNGQLTGVVTQDILSGLYFLSIGSNTLNDTIELKFYSGLKKEILAYQTNIPFVPNQVLGNIEQPYEVELSPVVPIFLQNDTVNYHIIDSSFVGELQYQFVAYDSLYPHCLADSALTKICIVDDLLDLVTYYQDADGDGLGNPLQTILSCGNPPDGYVSNGDDCDDGNSLDPNAIITITESSGAAANDGIICSNSSASLTATGGTSYLWSNGNTNSNITITPPDTDTYTVTVTFAVGCKGVAIADILVEGKVVTNSDNDGFGTLRSVLSCAVDGDTITYDQPSIFSSQIISPLVIDKHVLIQGMDMNHRPEISIDFNQTPFGIQFLSNKSVKLEFIDIKLVNPSNKPLITGQGDLIINNYTKVLEE